MDAFVALMTEAFHDSLYTDQEVGFALCRDVPMIAVKLGKVPYGFLAKFQALSCTWDEAPKEIAGLLMAQPRMLDAYVEAVRSCPGFNEGNALAGLLPQIGRLTEGQAQQLVVAFNENPQVSGSFGFSGDKPHPFGKGLPFHLTRATGREYRLNAEGKLVT